MIAIQMVGFDVVLGIQWLQSLGTMAINFQELFMRFSLERKENELRGIQGRPSKVILSNIMTKLLKRGHCGVIVQLCPLDVQTSRPSAPVDLQKVMKTIPRYLERCLKVFHLLEIMTMLFICNREVYHLTSNLTGTHMHKGVRLSLWFKKC
jgi:hypothetical protein